MSCVLLPSEMQKYLREQGPNVATRWLQHSAAEHEVTVSIPMRKSTFWWEQDAGMLSLGARFKNLMELNSEFSAMASLVPHALLWDGRPYNLGVYPNSFNSCCIRMCQLIPASCLGFLVSCSAFTRQ